MLFYHYESYKLSVSTYIFVMSNTISRISMSSYKIFNMAKTFHAYKNSKL